MNTESFTETSGLVPFDWNAFLAVEEHTEAEWDAAARLSGKWVTCACGVQCAAIPRYDIDDPDKVEGYPKDQTLAGLGCDFDQEIRSREIHKARHFLKKIERRSAQILAEMATSTSTPTP